LTFTMASPPKVLYLGTPPSAFVGKLASRAIQPTPMSHNCKHYKKCFAFILNTFMINKISL